MHFLTNAQTDIGIRKPTNQDSVLMIHMKDGNGREIVVSVVCDGIGGLECGEKASAIVIRRLSSWARDVLPSLFNGTELNVKSLKKNIRNIVDESNEAIIAMSEKYSMERSEDVQSGTTMCMLLAIDDRYYTANVGDSRVYRIRDGALSQLTKDQTVVQQELDEGLITEADIPHHKHQHMLTHCIGTEEKVYLEFTEGDIKDGDVFFVCSDGFRGKIDQEDFLNWLRPEYLVDERALYDQAAYCILKAKERREKDNISVVLIKAAAKQGEEKDA